MSEVPEVVGLPLSILPATEIAKLAQQKGEIDIVIYDDDGITTVRYHEQDAEGAIVAELEPGTIIRVRILNSGRVYLFKLLEPASGQAMFVRWNRNKPSHFEVSKIGRISSPVLKRGGTLDFKNDEHEYSLILMGISTVSV